MAPALGLSPRQRGHGVAVVEPLSQGVEGAVGLRHARSWPGATHAERRRLTVAHVLRNPMIYLLFSRLGLVTGLGSGVFRVIQLVREATGREPDIAELDNELVVTLPRPVHG